MRKAQNRAVPVVFGASAAMLAVVLATAAHAQTKEPIKIGVIAEAQAVAGSSIPQAAQLAAEEINAAGGVNGRKVEIVAYDNHSSAAESVRAFQRAANEDHVNAVIASYISEVVLALEPWAGRLKTVMVTPGRRIRRDHAKHRQGLRPPQIHVPRLPDARPASPHLVCAAAKDLLVDDLHMKTAVVMSEDAAWTTPLDAEYLKCLPEDRAEGAGPHPLLARHDRFHADLQQDRRREAGRDHHRHFACRRAADGAVEAAASADPDVRRLLAGDQRELLERHQRRDRGRALSCASPDPTLR